MTKFFVRIKIYFDRARGYTVYVQMFMAVVVFFKVAGIAPDHWWAWGIYMAIYCGGSILVGWIDYRAGVFGEEQRRHTSSNPMLIEMNERLKTIESKLEK